MFNLLERKALERRSATAKLSSSLFHFGALDPTTGSKREKKGEGEGEGFFPGKSYRELLDDASSAEFTVALKREHRVFPL